jgi:hypothetical protein
MKKIFYKTLIFLTTMGCSQTIENDSSSVATLMEIKALFERREVSLDPIDVRKVVTRQMIDDAAIPLLFVEKGNKQNGTYALYPGESIEETWLGADGSTLTLSNGELLATRGLGNDLMGSSFPRLAMLNERVGMSYGKEMRFLTSDNQLFDISLLCNITEADSNENIYIFDLKHDVRKYSETCTGNDLSINNEFWQKNDGQIVMSTQYHSESLNYLLLMRLN